MQIIYINMRGLLPDYTINNIILLFIFSLFFFITHIMYSYRKYHLEDILYRNNYNILK